MLQLNKSLIPQETLQSFLHSSCLHPIFSCSTPASLSLHPSLYCIHSLFSLFAFASTTSLLSLLDSFFSSLFFSSLRFTCTPPLLQQLLFCTQHSFRFGSFRACPVKHFETIENASLFFFFLKNNKSIY